MPNLSTYRTAVQRLLGTDTTQAIYTNVNLNSYINTARQQVAMEGQCIRALPPVSGPISTITILSAGTGFDATTQVVISAPDSPDNTPPNPLGLQASAAAVGSGALTAVTVLSAGDGYFAPSVTFSGTGQGAVAVAVISGINTTITGQEVYTFSSVTPQVAISGTGISSVFMVNSISVLWGNSRYTLAHLGWSKFQALYRNYTQITDVPTIWSQFGQGVSGSVYVQPVPNAPYQWEWDVCCLPSDLLDDTTVDAVPLPWDQAVIYYAAYLAFQFAQRFADADRMFQQFEVYMKRARMFSQPRSVSSWYGRV